MDSVLVVGLFIFSIYSLLSLGRLLISNNLSISWGCPICWHIAVHRFSYDYCDISCYFSSFICYFVYFGPLSFLMSLNKALLISIFSKNQLLTFIGLFLFLKSFHFISFFSGLMLSSLLPLAFLGCFCFGWV